MSHITDVKLRVTDLDALADACEELGLELKRGQTTHKWFGRFMADSDEGRRVAAERGAESFGTCEHAISVKGVANAYEIGLAKTLDGGAGYDLVFDSWSTQGGAITSRAGANLSALRQEYAAQVAIKRAKAKMPGWKVSRTTLDNGTMRLRLRRR